MPPKAKQGLNSLWAGVRQYFYPPEFRIGPPAWPDELAALLERLVEGERVGLSTDSSSAGVEAERQHVRLLVDVGTGLWRLRQRMVDPETGRPLEEMRRVFRHLESVWDALAGVGVEIQDHTGAPYRPGLSLRVIAFQPTEGFHAEKVIETIKPSIYYKGQSVQTGEVIVGTPGASDASHGKATGTAV
jgi:hypothetical protein